MPFTSFFFIKVFEKQMIGAEKSLLELQSLVHKWDFSILIFFSLKVVLQASEVIF